MYTSLKAEKLLPVLRACGVQIVKVHERIHLPIILAVCFSTDDYLHTPVHDACCAPAVYICTAASASGEKQLLSGCPCREEWPCRARWTGTLLHLVCEAPQSAPELLHDAVQVSC